MPFLVRFCAVASVCVRRQFTWQKCSYELEEVSMLPSKAKSAGPLSRTLANSPPFFSKLTSNSSPPSTCTRTGDVNPCSSAEIKAAAVKGQHREEVEDPHEEV